MGSCFTILTRWPLPYLYYLRRNAHTDSQVLHRAAEFRMIGLAFRNSSGSLAIFTAIRRALAGCTPSAAFHIGCDTPRSDLILIKFLNAQLCFKLFVLCRGDSHAVF